MDRQKNNMTELQQKDYRTERQKNRKTERQKDIRTERQKDRKTERQKYSPLPKKCYFLGYGESCEVRCKDGGRVQWSDWSQWTRSSSFPSGKDKI